jgi:hypothetical protein
MTIIKTIEDFQKYCTISYNFNLATIQPYLVKADRKYLKRYLSKKLYKNYVETKPTDETAVEVYDLMQEASANIALLYYTKVGIIHITDGGFSIAQNEKTKPAEWWQVRDLRRQLLETGMEAIDDALRIMQNTSGETFKLWKDSEAYTEFSEFFTQTTDDFQERYNINESRMTFINLKPHIKRTEAKYFKSVLGTETIVKIKLADNDFTKKAMELAKDAQVDFSVSEIANEGAFIFKPNGLFILTDEIPGKEKSELTENQLKNLSTIKKQSANEHLKALIKYLNENQEEFPEFANIRKPSFQSPIHNTGSIVSF